MDILFLGSKEFPMGVNEGDDPIPSGGIEIYVENLIKNLTKRGDIRVKIITRKFQKIDNDEADDRIVIYRVPWIGGFFFRNISFNFMAFLKAFRIDCDLVHAHGPVAAFFGLVLSKIKRTPLVVSPHGLALEQPQYNSLLKHLFSMLEKFVYSRSDFVVFSSDPERDEFKRKLGFLPRRNEIVTPGVDVERFGKAKGENVKEEFNLENRRVVTFVGRLIQVKGLEYLIRGMEGLDESVALLIVGDGPQRKELEDLVSKLKLDNIIFTGQRSDVAEIMAATDIFVLPSLSEGLPMALLEAMASGKACVVTDIGLPVDHLKDAFVVKPGDTEGLGNGIKELLENEDLRTGLGDAAKRKAEKDFSWNRAVDKYVELFNEISRKNI